MKQMPVFIAKGQWRHWCCIHNGERKNKAEFFHIEAIVDNGYKAVSMKVRAPSRLYDFSSLIGNNLLMQFEGG